MLAGGLWHFVRNVGFAAGPSMQDIERMRKNWKALLADRVKAPLPSEPVKLSKEAWRRRLDAVQFEVLREAGTEPPGSSPLNGEKRPGVFTCAGCDLPLFTSAMKYESGTGWPSFFTTIPDVFGTSTDYWLVLPRTEYHCIRCGGHHGHVFDDGPPPTGQRWCNNGVALKFIPKNGKA
jgi:peptide-methionine (R)-S-oxide reductase